MAAKSESGGGTGILVLSSFVLLGYILYKKVIVPDIVKPVKMVQEITRMQITNPKVGMDIKGKKVWISFVINNPNNEPLHISAIVGTVSVHQADPKQPGLNIGQIDQFKPIDVKPLSATPVTLTVTLRAVNTIAYITEVLTGKWNGQQVTFSGTVNANGKPFPVNETMTFSL